MAGRLGLIKVNCEKIDNSTLNFRIEKDCMGMSMFITPHSRHTLDCNGVFNASKFRKALFGGIAALILIAPISVQAQQSDQSPRSHAGRGGGSTGGQGGRQGGSTNGGQSGRQGGGTYGGQGRHQGGGTYGGQSGRQGGAHGGHDGFRRPDGFDPNGYSQHRFQQNPYHRPPGWINRRWRQGEFMPQIFWGQQYWLGDWRLFDLYAPPFGCICFRYGDDAVLIDERSGEVLDVIYGVF